MILPSLPQFGKSIWEPAGYLPFPLGLCLFLEGFSEPKGANSLRCLLDSLSFQIIGRLFGVIFYHIQNDSFLREKYTVNPISSFLPSLHNRKG